VFWVGTGSDATTLIDDILPSLTIGLHISSLQFSHKASHNFWGCKGILGAKSKFDGQVLTLLCIGYRKVRIAAVARFWGAIGCEFWLQGSPDCHKLTMLRNLRRTEQNCFTLFSGLKMASNRDVFVACRDRGVWPLPVWNGRLPNEIQKAADWDRLYCYRGYCLFFYLANKLFCSVLFMAAKDLRCLWQLNPLPPINRNIHKY